MVGVAASDVVTQLMRVVAGDVMVHTLQLSELCVDDDATRGDVMRSLDSKHALNNRQSALMRITDCCSYR